MADLTGQKEAAEAVAGLLFSTNGSSEHSSNIQSEAVSIEGVLADIDMNTSRSELDRQFVVNVINTLPSGTVITPIELLELGFGRYTDRTEGSNRAALNTVLKKLAIDGGVQNIKHGKYARTGEEILFKPRVRRKVVDIEGFRFPEEFFDIELPDDPDKKRRALDRQWRIKGIGIYKPTYSKKGQAQDSINQYFQDLADHPLLTVKGERFLFENLHSTKDPVVKQWIKQKLIETNLRLVVSIAKRYPPAGTLDFSDYFAEGNIGLEHSIDKFDVSKGYKLSTYATFWIKQAIGRLIEKRSSDFTASAVEVGMARKLKADLNNLGLSTKSSTEEISEALGVTVAVAERVVGLHREMFAIRLDRSVGEDEETTLGDLIISTADFSEVVIDDLQAADIKKKIQEVIQSELSPQEAFVYLSRNGFLSEDGKIASFREIGKSRGVTPEAARRNYERIKQRIQPKLRKALNEHEYLRSTI